MINSEIKRCVTVMIPYDETTRYSDAKFLVLEHVKCKHKFTLYIKYDNIRRKFQRMAYYDRIDGHRVYLETTFIVRIGNQGISNMEPDKHPSLKWVSLEEIFNNPTDYTYNTWLCAA